MSLMPVEMVTVKIEPDWEDRGEETARVPREMQHQNLIHVEIKEEVEDKDLSANMCRTTSGSPGSHISNSQHETDMGETHSNIKNSSTTETYKCDTPKRGMEVQDSQRSMEREESGLGITDKETKAAGTSRRAQGGRSKAHEQTRPEEEPYSCGICNKKFRHISNLNIHERIHTGEKPFSCEVCQQRFAQLSNLKVHKRIHTGEKPYACGTCEQRFTMLSNLKKHERIHTGDKPYSCGMCQQKFTLLGNLKTHERIHTGEKIYSCGTCERKFTQLSSLKSHERTHTGEKPFWCDLCQKGYTRKSHLDQHVRKRKKKPASDVANKSLVKSEPV